jgi:hypothetical protein
VPREGCKPSELGPIKTVLLILPLIGARSHQISGLPPHPPLKLLVMADKITLHGQVMHPSSDRPWSEAHINWSFVGFATTATTQRPTDRGTIIADVDGRWSKDFWINQAGDRPSYYVFDFPPDRGLRVKLTQDLPPVCEFSQALLNGVPPESPDYPSLIAIIDDRLAGSGMSLPSGGRAGQILAVVQAGPRVLGWEDSRVVFAQTIAQANWVFNHTLNRVPTIEVTDLVGNRLFVETQATQTQAIVRSQSPITGFVYLT